MEGDADEGATNPGLADVPEWPETERLKFEKEALDFYISSHPLAQHDEQLRRYRTHDAGPLAHGPFVAVNCATVPPALAERLFFGARKGAYSGAESDADKGHWLREFGHLDDDPALRDDLDMRFPDKDN